jgi:hypothetical protein
MKIAYRTLTFNENNKPIQIQITINAPVRAQTDWYCNGPLAGHTGGARRVLMVPTAFKPFG